MRRRKHSEQGGPAMPGGAGAGLAPGRRARTDRIAPPRTAIAPPVGGDAAQPPIPQAPTTAPPGSAAGGIVTGGPRLADAQRALNAQGFDCGEPDGIMGPRTRAAVIAFQRAHGLAADGVIGPQTLAALGAAPATPSTPGGAPATPGGAPATPSTPGGAPATPPTPGAAPTAPATPSAPPTPSTDPSATPSTPGAAPSTPATASPDASAPSPSGAGGASASADPATREEVTAGIAAMRTYRQVVRGNAVVARDWEARVGGDEISHLNYAAQADLDYASGLLDAVERFFPPDYDPAKDKPLAELRGYLGNVHENLDKAQRGFTEATARGAAALAEGPGTRVATAPIGADGAPTSDAASDADGSPAYDPGADAAPTGGAAPDADAAPSPEPAPAADTDAAAPDAS